MPIKKTATKKTRVIKETKTAKKEAKEISIGKVFSYYTNIGVAALELTDELCVGDTIHIKGTTTDFTQKVDSIQIEHDAVKKAPKGSSIGIKVKDRVRPNDIVYKVG